MWVVLPLAGKLCSLNVHSALASKRSRPIAWVDNQGLLHSSRAWWALGSFHFLNCWRLLVVHIYKYWAHLIAWSIFFGPIVLLIPFLLLHEILILLTFDLTYTLHGVIRRALFHYKTQCTLTRNNPGSLPDQYEALRLSSLDARELLFSFVDRSSNVFNRWTANHMPLMVLRLAGGALGGVLLFVIWMGWWSPFSAIDELVVHPLKSCIITFRDQCIKCLK